MHQMQVEVAKIGEDGEAALLKSNEIIMKQGFAIARLQVSHQSI